MFEYDINYFASILSNMCGMPVRIYEDNIKTEFFSDLSFPKDPALLIEDSLNQYTNNLGYIEANYFYYYGYVNYKNKKLLLGPSRLIKPDSEVLSNLALELNIDKDDLELFKSSMSSIIPLPLESMIQALCSINYVLNHEKVALHDIIINKNEITYEADIPNEYIEGQTEHNTIDIENNLMRIVTHGEIIELREWLKSAPAVRGGVLSNDALRQVKNTFIASVTLISRAAIKGGLDTNIALSLSDLYIQKMEMLTSLTDINTLQMNLILDYTERVSKIRGKSDASPFLININKYIYSHISEAIKSSDICNDLYISKSVLFDKLKKETGMTVSEYILNIKVNESKGLLKYSDKSILAISNYLGFPHKVITIEHLRTL